MKFTDEEIQSAIVKTFPPVRSEGAKELRLDMVKAFLAELMAKKIIDEEINLNRDLMVLDNLIESAHASFSSPKAGGFTFLIEAKRNVRKMMKSINTKEQKESQAQAHCEHKMGNSINDEIPWNEWHGGKCPLKDEVEEWEYKNRFGEIIKERGNATVLRWYHANLDGDIIAYRVLKWRDGCGPVDWKAKYEGAEKNLRAKFEPEVKEANARAEKAEAELAKAREAITILQDQEAEVDTAAHEAGWNGDNPKNLAQFIKNQSETIEEWSRHIHPAEHDRIVKSIQDRAKADIAEARLESLSRLRPIYEAGPVPEGCVRVTARITSEGHIINPTCNESITHFADIQLTAAKAEDSDEPETFEACGKTWTRHTAGDAMPCELNRSVEVVTQKAIDGKDWYSCPHDSSYWQWDHGTKIIGWRYADEPAPEPLETEQWTPKPGNVVMLNSDGPKMTISEVNGDEAKCIWFDPSKGRNVVDFKICTLKPV